MGNLFLEQIKKVGFLGKFFVDFFDNCISYGKRNMLKILGCFLVVVFVFFFCKVVVIIVVKEVGNLILWYSFLFLEQVVDCVIKNVCRNVSK